MNVPYHLGANDEYSLAYVALDEDALSTFLSREEPTDPTFRTVRTGEGDELLLAYTQSTPSSPPEVDVSTWSDGTATLAYAYLTAFRGVQVERHVPENKSFDLDRIARIFERVRWRQSVSDVAGQLISTPILAHALPNANHRSALAFTSLYLGYYCGEDDLATHWMDNDQIRARIDEFQLDSKRLLTVRRNTTPFRLLAEAGVTTVERKGDVFIQLDDYDLECSNPYETYADRHHDLCVEFVEDVLELGGYASVCGETDKGKSAFVAHLQAGR